MAGLGWCMSQSGLGICRVCQVKMMRVQAVHDVHVQGIWNKIMWLWELPPVKQLRITMTMAQWSVRLPAIIALFATQGGLLATQVTVKACR